MLQKKLVSFFPRKSPPISLDSSLPRTLEIKKWPSLSCLLTSRTRKCWGKQEPGSPLLPLATLWQQIAWGFALHAWSWCRLRGLRAQPHRPVPTSDASCRLKSPGRSQLRSELATNQRLPQPPLLIYHLLEQLTELKATLHLCLSL